MNRTITALAVFIVATASMDSAFAADARKGETLAKRWCATCHVVASDQKRANGQAPPFSSVGKMPDLDSGKLALFLLLPHPKMPDMNLSRAEAADLAAYIATRK